MSDFNIQNISNGVRAVTLLSVEEYEKGIKQLVSKILEYFVDDVVFGFVTPSGPDATFEITAPRLDANNKYIPGNITMTTMPSEVEWDSDVFHSRWRYLSYDALLQRLHGDNFIRPLQKANALIDRIRKQKEIPELDTTKLTVAFKPFINLDLPNNSSDIQEFNLDVSKVEIFNQIKSSVSGSLEVSSTVATMASFLTFLESNPQATHSEIKAWISKESESKTSKEDNSNKSSLSLSSLLPEFKELDLDQISDEAGYESPTACVADLWPMEFLLSNDFPEDEKQLGDSEDSLLIEMLNKEIAKMPIIAGGGAKRKWLVMRRGYHPMYEVPDGEIETFAISEPEEESKLQFYWSSDFNNYWARVVI